MLISALRVAWLTRRSRLEDGLVAGAVLGLRELYEARQAILRLTWAVLCLPRALSRIPGSAPHPDSAGPRYGSMARAILASPSADTTWAPVR